jgi:L-threonylcarbamoyladenylate synthase
MVYSVKVNQGMFNPNFDKQIELAAEAMIGGKVVAFPTDTVYGLGCSCQHDQAIADLYTVKGRPAGLRMPLLLSDYSQIEQVAPPLSDLANEIAAKYWPGPLTLVVRCHPHVNRRIIGSEDTVAIRIPAHYVPRQLARLVGTPIIGTSANKSGDAPCTTYHEVNEAFPFGLASILDGGVCGTGVESTIVDCTSDQIRVVRDGAVDISHLLN